MIFLYVTCASICNFGENKLVLLLQTLFPKVRLFSLIDTYTYVMDLLEGLQKAIMLYNQDCIK